MACLNNVELGQQVAVSQCEVVSIKETALGDPEAGVLGQLVLQRGTQVLIQLQQGPQQVPLQRCREGGQVMVQPCCGHGAPGLLWPPASPAPCPGSTCQPLPTWLSPPTCLCPPTEAWHSHTGPRRDCSAWTDLTVDWMGGLGKLSVTRLGFGVWHPRSCMGCSSTRSSPSSWAGTGFLIKAENLWKISFPARLDSGYCGTRLGHLWGHGHS